LSVPFHKILVGVGLDPRSGTPSAGSRVALDEVRWLARHCGDAPLELALLHSTAADEYWDDSEHEFVRVAADDVRGAPALEAAAASLRAEGIDTEVELSSESAWLALTRRVLREKIDLVVVGRRSMARSDRRRLGSVASKLLRNCPCAVWVVRPDGEPGPQRILAATDLSPVGDRVVEVAANLAGLAGARLGIVHAYSLPLSLQMEGERERQRDIEEQRETARRQIQAHLHDPAVAERATLHIGLTSPTRAVGECVEHLQPDLLVMGTVSRGGVAGLLVGNTAERLIDRVECSLLTLKPEDVICPVQLD